MITRTENTSSKQRRIRARRSAVQALYQWGMTNSDVEEIISEFLNERSEIKKADAEYFCELVKGTLANMANLINELKPYLDRPIDSLDPVERAVLLVSLYELIYRPELPWRVVVNESVELAKMFGAEQSHKFINGVMDKVAHKIRSVEISNAS
ncbi:MAG: transcription antitermination factor NusB [Gammaproteobacteria bacterium]|nr:transcription antitermination factor NusB [Gammaproteobacteria bacterium]NIN61433.1 transcription antitermination factor NusB [Gammaproteobacteria bacterium]NIO61200.1 transcription antitermination factor NusB [Gammaproteobacteria bacterium]NIP48866.1 transcription antitermination factor NusB [Gammaproteobacteria bacterium]NIQ09320.1 transcription antitermination factor NusB [Gammaproteobacteria bacterium]